MSFSTCKLIKIYGVKITLYKNKKQEKSVMGTFFLKKMFYLNLVFLFLYCNYPVFLKFPAFGQIIFNPGFHS